MSAELCSAVDDLSTSYPHHLPPKTHLCQRYQNMSLKLRGIKACGIKVANNPDTFVKDQRNGQALQAIIGALPEEVKYSQWKRVEDSEGKKKMKIVSCVAKKDEFATTLEEDTKSFEEHVERVKVQYDQLNALKDRHPQNRAIVQMDFAENYMCQASEEVQSAYWNASMVTTHPAVSYMSLEEKIEHTSRVFVSDKLRHNSGTVFAIMKLISEMRMLILNKILTNLYRRRHIEDVYLSKK